MTDVDGVFTEDPRLDNTAATLLSSIGVNGDSGEIVTLDPQSKAHDDDKKDNADLTIAASKSLHPQDVTGGFQTKLAAALHVAASGTNVTIAKCGSVSAVKALQIKQHTLI